jgi:hypothetical protein
MKQTRPAKVRTLDIDGQPVRCIETADGKRGVAVRLPEVQGARH